MSAALNFALSLFMSITLVPLFMRYAAALGLVDKPDGVRKIHTEVIPRSGGLAIAAAVILPLLYLAQNLQEIYALLLSSGVIVVFGFLDDRYELSYKWKFLGQIIAIIIFLTSIPEISKTPFFYLQELPSWLIYGIAFMFLLGTTNAVNLSDGLDGLAAGTILLSLALIAYLAYEANMTYVFMTATGVMGSLLGFLRYNTHPARVFMGDTGSQFIGFTSAAMAILVTQYPGCAVSPILPLMVLGLPIIDTLMVIVIRMNAGRSPFAADKNHIHHQLMKLGLFHYEAVALIYVLQIILILSAYILRFDSDYTLLAIFGLYAATVTGGIYLGRKKHWQFHAHQQHTQSIERRNLFLRRFNWFYQHSSRVITVFIGASWVVLANFAGETDNSIRWLAQLSLLTAFLFGVFMPKNIFLSTRILCYASSVLTLYPFLVNSDVILSRHLLNILIANLGILLLLAIRFTRREHFRLDNQDILVLFILLAGPLLPTSFNSGDGVDIGAMLLRLAVMLYTVEYIINKEYQRYLLLSAFSSVALFIIAFF